MVLEEIQAVLLLDDAPCEIHYLMACLMVNHSHWLDAGEVAEGVTPRVDSYQDGEKTFRALEVYLMYQVLSIYHQGVDPRFQENSMQKNIEFCKYYPFSQLHPRIPQSDDDNCLFSEIDIGPDIIEL